MSTIILLLIAAFFLALSLILWILSVLLRSIAWALKTPAQRKEDNWRRKRKKLQTYKFHQRATKAALVSPGYAGLWHQLLIRVNFDIPTAERLVQQLHWKFPGKGDRWYIEKAIYDIERDRRR